MVKKYVVTKVVKDKNGETVAVKYEKSNGKMKKAGVVEGLSPKVGDLVWIFRESKLDYKGFNAVAVLHG